MTLSGAENGTRTRDLNLGKVALYQLSYFRKVSLIRMNPYEWTAKLVKFYLTPKIFSHNLCGSCRKNVSA